MEADRIVIFLSRYQRQPSSDPSSTIPRYSELAEGNFPVDTDNEALKETLERIREIIRRSRSQETL